MILLDNFKPDYFGTGSCLNMGEYESLFDYGRVELVDWVFMLGLNLLWWQVKWSVLKRCLVMTL